MAIMPEVQSRPETPPSLYIERMSRADKCPDCCENLEVPYRIEPTAHGFMAYYGCEHCGWFWSTGWGER